MASSVGRKRAELKVACRFLVHRKYLEDFSAYVGIGDESSIFARHPGIIDNTWLVQGSSSFGLVRVLFQQDHGLHQVCWI